MKALVTGAGGFVGKELVKHLIAHGHHVRAMIRNPAQAKELETLGVETVIAELLDPTSVKKAVTGVDKVFHIAALFRQAGLPSSEFFRVNVEGTRNVLDACVESGVRTVVHCSTVGVHGHIEHPPATELTPYNPGDPYQESKMEGEKLFLQYVKDGKLSGAVIRPAMIYGPGDSRTLKLFKGIAQKRFFYVGPGTSLVHFIDVRDLADAFRRASETPNINGEVFIIGGETSLPLRDLATIIASVLGVRKPWLHLPIKPMQMLGSLCEAICTPLRINPPIFRRRVDFFTKDRNFDCTKAQKLLGFQPAQHLLGEVIDIINSYISLGMIKRESISKSSAIVRDISGRIHGWDEDAQSIYGWSKHQAVGAVSHTLLSTQFPSDLEAINSQLVSKGEWKGQLVHRDKEGRAFQVESTWKLLPIPSRLGQLILELNQASSSDARRPFPIQHSVLACMQAAATV